VCGRTTSTTSREGLALALGVDEVEAPELPISWNVAPTRPVYAVTTGRDGARKLRALSWGLVPSWAQDRRIGARLINARAETVTGKPAFRSAVRSRRALLPVSGFYEWRRPEPGTRAHGQPFFFHAADGQPLVFAGLWETWRDAEGHAIHSCSIITTTANQTVAPVHHRMPVVLAPLAWDEWLRPGPLNPSRLGELLVPAPEDLLDGYPVGTAVNNARSDGPHLTFRASPGRGPAERLTLFPAGYVDAVPVDYIKNRSEAFTASGTIY
jgi:putative SOS response-associated peptidase YedK